MVQTLTGQLQQALNRNKPKSMVLIPPHADASDEERLIPFEKVISGP